MRLDVLKWIVETAAPRAGGQYAHGYAYIGADQTANIKVLHEAGYVMPYFQNANEKGEFPVVPTADGVAVVKANGQQPPKQEAPAFQAQPAPQSATAALPEGFRIDNDIPMPAVTRRGFQPSEGGSAIDRYKFDQMQVGQSFHLSPSGDPEKPIHRTFSSTVSIANKKLHPKAFAIRPVGSDDPLGEGARVWRINDMVGERPTRARRTKPEDTAPQPQVTGFGTAPGQATPFGGFGAPQGGFGTAPAGTMGDVPQGFGGGFAGPPAGFGQG